MRVRAGAAIDAALAHAARRRPVVEWGISQAMHVFGASTAHEAFAAAAAYRTREVSALVTQDVLLCAGAEDHYVPLHQLYDQARWLTHARSVTTRLFARADHAQKVGNLGLALHTIAAWIDAIVTAPAASQAAGAPHPMRTSGNVREVVSLAYDAAPCGSDVHRRRGPTMVGSRRMAPAQRMGRVNSTTVPCCGLQQGGALRQLLPARF
jgi:hypothetical protein